MALKIDDKQKRSDSQGRGRGGNARGGGRFVGRSSSNKSKVEIGNQEKLEGDTNPRGGFRGRRPNGRGRFGGRRTSMFTRRCFSCNQVGHPSFRCSKKIGVDNQGERRIQLI